jgi:conserved oligomeric Golgi complex subunit 4
MAATLKSSSSSLLADKVPTVMIDTLETEDPYQALLALSDTSKARAQQLSNDLMVELEQFTIALPELLKTLPNPKDMDSHPVANSMACTDSILHSLTKIATGGSQASQDIRLLEQEKRELEEHAQDVETALILRKSSDVAAQSLSAQKYELAAKAIHDYLSQKQWNRLTDRAKAYAGEYTVTQLDSTQQALRSTLLGLYQEAVTKQDLIKVGQLTPLVQMVQMEKEVVTLYLRFLKGILDKDLAHAVASSSDKNATTTTTSTNKPNDSNNTPPPYVAMGRVYNSAVTTLRHHLPMVSHCLHRADGDAAVVQLIHVQVERAVGPLFQSYISNRQLATSAENSQRVYAMLEERYGGRSDFGHDDSAQSDLDDCGFSSHVGTLSDVDSAMEEAALCIQHSESYMRFIGHTVREVNKARELRHRKAQEERRMERERREWATGMSAPHIEEEEEDYVALEILPAHTQVHEVVAEVGGYYSVIERCLLLASMQRAFAVPEDDPRQYSPLSGIEHRNSSSVGSRALQTAVVENCLYAARRGTQRAFATGHTGTASAVANFCSDCLRGVVVEFLSRRAEDMGVSALKPGEGLLEGSAGIFNAQSLIRQGQTATLAVGGVKVDEVTRRREIEQGISWACASLNDLEVASRHCQELEKILLQAVDSGFPPNSHDTEQLRMCVKTLSPVTEVLKLSSNTAIESLVAVLQPRMRAIVSDAVGADSSASAGFSSVMGGGKTMDASTVRMDYDLDEEAYQLLEVSEGYISRLYVSNLACLCSL